MASNKGCGCGAPPSTPRIPETRLSSGQPTLQPNAQSCGQMQQPPPQPPPPGSSGPGRGGDSGMTPIELARAQKLQERIEKEQREAELNRWVSPLRMFDKFASGELQKRDRLEEDFPKLKVPQLKGHHRCKVSCLLNHQVDYAIDMEQELRNIGIQETQMMDMLEKLTRAEAAVRFQGAVRAAEVAAMSAPPELAEEAAVAGARGYTVETQEFSKSSKPGENPIEIIGYIGCTRPTNF